MNEYKNIKKGIFPRIKEVIEKNSRKAYITVKIKNKKEKNLRDLFMRDEYEFLLENVDNEKINSVRSMFLALEYPIEHIFEKRRYRLENINNCDFVVDELPFGFFIEIEGEENDIEKSIIELGLGKKERINKAYLKLWDEFKTQNNLIGECIFRE